jgi:hypothetical protein
MLNNAVSGCHFRRFFSGIIYRRIISGLFSTGINAVSFTGPSNPAYNIRPICFRYHSLIISFTTMVPEPVQLPVQAYLFSD